METDMRNSITKVYVIEEYSCVHGDGRHILIGIFASLDKAQVAYENAKDKAKEELESDESWYEDENVQCNDMYFELMDNTIAPEKYYQLQLEEQPLQ